MDIVDPHLLLSQLGPLVRATAPPAAVVVQAYTESLCIDCQHFFDRQLLPAYQRLGSEIISLQIVPFGNAKINETQETVECQHKDAECDANSWEQCAVEAFPPEKYIGFFGCLETALPMGSRSDLFDPTVFETCAEISGLDFEILQNCHDDHQTAWALQKKYAELTPPHDHVPWVVLDGQKFDEESDDLFVEVCKAYVRKGGSSPECSSVLEFL